MVTANKLTAALVVGLFIASVASPSLAQTREEHISAARAAAIHECNAEAVHRYAYMEDGNRSDVYRACMAQHGQPE